MDARRESHPGGGPFQGTARASGLKASTLTQCKDNLAWCEDLSEGGLLNELKKRYQENKFYTAAGKALVAVNPVKKLPIFSDEAVVRYQHSSIFSAPPHVYSIADLALTSLSTTGVSQSVLLSGEIGSGKTQTAKQVIRYVFDSSLIRSRLKELSIVRGTFFKAGHLQEVFGNAPVSDNGDSSRFSRTTELLVDPKTCALQATRVSCFDFDATCLVSSDHVAFHVYYHVLAAASPPLLKKMGILKSDLSKHRYLSPKKAITPEDLTASEATLSALQVLNISDSEKERLCCILGAIVRLGDIQFKGKTTKLKSKSGGAKQVQIAVIKNEAVVKCVAELLGIDAKLLKEALLSLELFQKTVNLVDEVAMELHKQIFNWIVDCGNGLFGGKKDMVGSSSILVVDTKEAEVAEVNGLEQFCTNLASEAFQQLFWQRLIVYEEDLYHAERIKWEDVVFDDNLPVLDLFFKPGEFIDVINSADPEDEKPVVASFQAQTEHWYPVQNSPNLFGVAHFSGEVVYDSSELVRKNCHQIPEKVADVLKTSSCSLVQKLAKNFGKHEQKQSATKETKETTKLGIFRNELDSLVDRIKLTMPHFIRCLKPNENMEADKFEREYVSLQFQRHGLADVTRLAACGYPLRFTHKEFVDRFGIIGFNAVAVNPTKDSCVQILKLSAIEGWCVGEQKVLLKDWNGVELEKQLHNLQLKAATIQRAVKRYLKRKKNGFSGNESSSVASKFSLVAAKVVEVQQAEKIPPPLPSRRLKQKEEENDDDDDETYVDLTQEAGDEMYIDITKEQANSVVPTVKRLGKLKEVVKENEYLDLSSGQRKEEYLDSEESDYLDLSSPQWKKEDEDRYRELLKSKDEEEDLYIDLGLESGEKRKKPTEVPHSILHPFMKRVSWAEKPREREDWASVRREKRKSSESMISRPSFPLNALEEQSWFHGGLSRADATALLQTEHSVPNLFLVRSSESGPGYSISINHNGRLKHFKVDKQSHSGRYIVMGHSRTFPSLLYLVAYYRRHPLSSDGELLLSAIPHNRTRRTSTLPSRPSRPASKCLSNESSSFFPPVLPQRKEETSPPPPVPPPRPDVMSAPAPRQGQRRESAPFADQISEIQMQIRVEESLRVESQSDLSLPTLDKKSKKERQKTLARSIKNLKRLQVKLSKLEDKQADMTPIW